MAAQRSGTDFKKAVAWESRKMVMSKNRMRNSSHLCKIHAVVVALTGCLLAAHASGADLENAVANYWKGDFEQARQQFEQSLDKGNFRAAYYLGIIDSGFEPLRCHARGDCPVPQSHARGLRAGLEWFELGSEEGDEYSLFAYCKALRYVAAERNMTLNQLHAREKHACEGAESRLQEPGGERAGVRELFLVDLRDGKPRNGATWASAEEKLKDDAFSRDHVAAFYLGRMKYSLGRWQRAGKKAPQQDLAEAFGWFYLATKLGNAHAASYLRGVAQELDKKHVSVAEQFAAEVVSKAGI